MSDDPDTIDMPDDAPVWTDADDLTTQDAPEANGTGDQTDGMGAL